MKRVKAIGVAGLLCLACAAQAAPPDPFASNNGVVPPKSAYSGPLFALSYDYPASAPAPAMPWRAALRNGRISPHNAGAYAQALKMAVGKDMSVLLQDYANWNPGQRGWYNEPWLYSKREAIHGMYVGGSALDTSLFSATGLTKPITTYVLTYYDRVAAQTLNKIWGSTAERARQPDVRTETTQFAEGSLIIKAAFITADAKVWPAMAGTLAWPAYITVNATTGQLDAPTVMPTYLMQFDIIVKDSASAPDTGWVFSTLVYDKRIKPGPNGVWDQMVVLGAQWGNDPQANSTKDPKAPLLQNWINPAAPAYSTATLGWGGRLSGPNDGAMNDISFIGTDGKRQYVKNAQDSSCMSCHSTAQWDAKAGMKSFLLPLMTQHPSENGPGSPYLNSPAPGSAEWLRWFQSRKGFQPMDAGSVAADFDMVLTFKSLPLWKQAMDAGSPDKAPLMLNSIDRTGKRVFDTPAQK